MLTRDESGRRSGFRTPRMVITALALALTFAVGSVAWAAVPTPKSVLGHTPGDDYYLADYKDSVKYFHQLAKASDRIKMVSIGKTTQGRTYEYAIISSPENLARFDQYVEISKKLADSRQLTDAQARELARTSKIIVHIDGGLHAGELADHQLPPLLAYKLLSEPDDPEVAAILDNVILILWPTLNPDGMDMEVAWYRRQLAGRDLTGPLPTKIIDQPMPYLYQEYVSHDNNRDGYMLNMIESQVVDAESQKNAPAIWYTHHQPGSAVHPERIWLPPFYDPISANIDPLTRVWTSNIGINMMSRFTQEGKSGVIAQTTYDNWYPGYLDYIAEFRHTMAYFTEATHNTPTPINYSVSDFPKLWQELKPQVFYPIPWKGGVWRFRDTLDYMITASMSTLDTALKYREELLYNRYLAGSRTMKRFVDEGLHAYVIPAGQADPQTAALLAQKLILQGLEVYQSKSPLALGQGSYPAGSWVIPMNQPFAGLAKELFERQKYPDIFLDKDGLPPKLPYDVTGWTLPLQFGVETVAITSPLPASVSAALERVSAAKTQGSVQGNGPAYAISQASNASYQVANAVLQKNGKVALVDGADTEGRQHDPQRCRCRDAWRHRQPLWRDRHRGDGQQPVNAGEKGPGRQLSTMGPGSGSDGRRLDAVAAGAIPVRPGHAAQRGHPQGQPALQAGCDRAAGHHRPWSGCSRTTGGWRLQARIHAGRIFRRHQPGRRGRAEGIRDRRRHPGGHEQLVGGHRQVV